MYIIFNFLGLTINSILNYIQLKKIKLKEKIQIIIIEFISILLGSKILDFIVNYKFYNNYVLEESFKKGYMFYGGLFLAITLIFLYCKIKEIDSKYVIKIVISNLLVTYAFCKIGCFFNGCCIGINDIPIQLIEGIICLSLYSILKLSEKSKSVSYSCIVFGIIRILDFILRKEISLSNLIVNELISITIFLLGIVKYFEKEK